MLPAGDFAAHGACTRVTEQDHNAVSRVIVRKFDPNGDRLPAQFARIVRLGPLFSFYHLFAISPVSSIGIFISETKFMFNNFQSDVARYDTEMIESLSR